MKRSDHEPLVEQPVYAQLERATTSEMDPSRPPPWGWFLIRSPDTGHRHGVPSWDVRAHCLDGQCWCRPELDEWGVVAHNSADGRERYEVYGAKRH